MQDCTTDPGFPRTSHCYAAEALEEFSEFFKKHREAVFFSRQLEVLNEAKYFHWITNRALRELRARGLLEGRRGRSPQAAASTCSGTRDTGSTSAARRSSVKLGEEYADPNI